MGTPFIMTFMQSWVPLFIVDFKFEPEVSTMNKTLIGIFKLFRLQPEGFPGSPLTVPLAGVELDCAGSLGIEVEKFCLAQLIKVKQATAQLAIRLNMLRINL